MVNQEKKLSIFRLKIGTITSMAFLETGSILLKLGENYVPVRNSICISGSVIAPCFQTGLRWKTANYVLRSALESTFRHFKSQREKLNQCYFMIALNGNLILILKVKLSQTFAFIMKSTKSPSSLHSMTCLYSIEILEGLRNRRQWHKFPLLQLIY